jgi:hypothetical protein
LRRERQQRALAGGLLTNCTARGSPSSPWNSGSETPRWPVALNTGVNGVNSPERVNVPIGCGAAVSSVPIGSGRSTSAGVSSAS